MTSCAIEHTRYDKKARRCSVRGCGVASACRRDGWDTAPSQANFAAFRRECFPFLCVVCVWCSRVTSPCPAHMSCRRCVPRLLLTCSQSWPLCMLTVCRFVWLQTLKYAVKVVPKKLQHKRVNNAPGTIFSSRCSSISLHRQRCQSTHLAHFRGVLT